MNEILSSVDIIDAADFILVSVGLFGFKPFDTYDAMRTSSAARFFSFFAVAAGGGGGPGVM